MVQTETILKIADNSGAKLAKVIGIPGNSWRRSATLGDIVVVAVQQAIPHGSIGRHQKSRAVIVRVKKERRRPDGSYIRFDENAAVLIDTQNKPKASRVFGPVARELKEKGFDKIISLAPEVL